MPTILTALSAVAQKLDGKYPGTTATLKFDLGSDGIYRIVITDGHCQAVQGDGDATATITMKLEDAVKLMSGKLNPMVAMTTGKIKVSGDMQVLMLLQGAMR